MQTLSIFTTTGQYWHYHPIGTGVIFTYHRKAKQILLVCKETGCLIQTIDKYEDGGYNSETEFKKEAQEAYIGMALSGVTRDLDFYEETSFIGESMVEIDLKLLMN